LEILPFFYALLAVLTGMSAGDRVALAERAPLAACATSAPQDHVHAQPSAALTARPSSLTPSLYSLVDAPQWTAVDLGRIFRVAGFSVRLN
jgi:hypothetical protein